MAALARCLSGLLDIGLESGADAVALASPERRWSWRELDIASGAYAANLARLGVRPGDRVASLLPNCDALLIHYLGCFKAGTVAVPLNYRFTPVEIDRALRVSGACALVHARARAADLAAIREARSLPRLLIAWSPGGQDFAELLREPAVAFNAPATEPDAPAAIFFTSGSTGPAKGVTHSGASLAFIFTSYGKALQVAPGDAVVALSAMSHFGAFMDLLAGMWYGARAVIPPSLDAGGIVPTLRDQRPTHGIAIPAVLFAVAQDPRARQGDFASFRMLGTGGDAVPAEMRRLVTALSGPEINEQFSMTEIGVACMNPVGGEIRPGSVGTVTPGYDLDIRDGNGTSVPAGEQGRLWVRSPGVMLGYWDSPDATREVFVDGWYDTGDVLSQDADGYLWFHGRQKQIIVHDGSNISPQEVEDALLLHPTVQLAGVVGVPHPVHGENVRAFVTLKPGAATPEAAELIAFARSRVGYKAPDSIVMLDQMPLTASHKVDRAALRRLSDQIT